MIQIGRRIHLLTPRISFINSSIRLVNRVRPWQAGTYIFLSAAQVPYHSRPQSRLFPMSSPSSLALQQLDCLDKSSPDFQDKVSNILYGQDYVRCVQNLQASDSVWLVDYLNDVRFRVPLLCSPLKLAQACDRLDPFSPASRKCFSELRDVCGRGAILPTTVARSSCLLETDSDPFAQGGFGDVYLGTLKGAQVCIKRLRRYSQDDQQKDSKVRLLTPLLSLFVITDVTHRSSAKRR